MKFIKFFALAAIFATIFVSCEKQELELNTKPEFTNNQTVDAQFDLSQVKVYENMLWFDNVELFNKTIDKLNNMDSDMRLTWEQNIGFVSLNSVYQKYYQKIDFSEVDKNSIRLVELAPQLFVEDTINEEIFVQETYKISILNLILNKDFLYRIGNVVYKILPEYQLSTTVENYDLLKNTNDANNVKDAKIKVFDMNITELDIDEKNQNKSCKFQYTYSQNASGGKAYFINCAHTRVCWLRMWSYALPTYSSDYTSTTISKGFYVRTWGQKKYCGRFHNYRTALSLNVENITIAGNNYSENKTATSKSLEYHVVYSTETFSGYSNSAYKNYFSSYDVKASSRGIGSDWVKLKYR